MRGRTGTPRPKRHSRPKNPHALDQLACADFEKVSALDLEEEFRNAASKIHNLATPFRLALTILGKSKPELTDAVAVCATGGATEATAMLDILKQGCQLADDVRDVIRAAEARVLICTANLCGPKSRSTAAA